MTASVAIVDGWCAIRLPEADRAALLAELEPCQCRAAKSAATAAARAGLVAALRAGGDDARVPIHAIHGIRVALAPCPCTPPDRDKHNLRKRLSMALGKLRT